jgi:hypothetical protein
MTVNVPELSAQPRSETPNTICSGASGPRSSVTVGVICPEARVRPYEQARHGSFCAHRTSLTFRLEDAYAPKFVGLTTPMVRRWLQAMLAEGPAVNSVKAFKQSVPE